MYGALGPLEGHEYGDACGDMSLDEKKSGCDCVMSWTGCQADAIRRAGAGGALDANPTPLSGPRPMD